MTKTYLNKSILITGGTSGLGKHLAIQYAKQGAHIINIARDSKKLHSLKTI